MRGFGFLGKAMLVCGKRQPTLGLSCIDLNLLLALQFL